MNETLPESDPAAENQVVADLRALVEAQTAQIAKLVAAEKETGVPVALHPDRSDDQEQSRHAKFGRGVLVTDVHEFDRLEAEQRLNEQGLRGWQPPLPEGTVTVDVAAAQNHPA